MEDRHDGGGDGRGGRLRGGARRSGARSRRARNVVENVGGAPDTVLYNGKISTVDANNTEVQAIAIRDGDIIATGPDGPIRALAQQHTKVINLQGPARAAGPDRRPHPRHARGLPLLDQGVRLDLVTSRAAALAMYAAKADELADGKLDLDRRRRLEPQPARQPAIFTFEELNAVAPKNPMWITGGGVTGPRVNQAALDAARPDRELARRRGRSTARSPAA